MEDLTIEDLYDQFDKLTGEDGYDKTHAYQLMTQAKNNLEEQLKLKVLETLDATQTANPGDTYLTKKSLPADYRQTTEMVVGNIPYFPIAMRRSIQLQSVPRKFYIDHKNKQFALTGKVSSSKVISHWYLCTTPEITVADEQSQSSDIIVWPSRFHAILPYRMAMTYQGGIDADFLAFRMSPSQAADYNELLDSLIAWDHDIKLKEMGNQGGYAEEYEGGDFLTDVGSM